MVEVNVVMSNTKASDLAKILRRLADYVDRCSDEELDPLFAQASVLMQSAAGEKKSEPKRKMSGRELEDIATKLRSLGSRDAGDDLLQKCFSNRYSLETMARYLNLPVQRD